MRRACLSIVCIHESSVASLRGLSAQSRFSQAHGAALQAHMSQDSVALHSGGTAPTDSVIRGELFKAGKDGAGQFKLRWFELTKKGELSWAESEAAVAKGTQPLRGCQIVMESIDRGKGELDARYGFSIHPPGAGLVKHKLQASSMEERLVWVDALERAAHPEAQRAPLIANTRLVSMNKPPGKGRLGLELADSASLTGQPTPCVTVTAVEDIAAEAGLLVGDIILMMGPTVLRNHSVALRCFANAGGEMTLRLACLTREVRVTKRSNMAGIQFDNAPAGPGVLVSGLQPDGAGVAAGLHLGDRVLSVHGKVATQGGQQAMEMAKEAGPLVRLVVSGVSTAIPIRKDADGRLGLQFVDGTPNGSVPSSAQGATIASVLPRSAAKDAGLRPGDLVVAVDDEIVLDVWTARDAIGRRTERSLTLVVWRPRVDAPTVTGGLGGGPNPGRANASSLDGESQKALRQEWYFATDLQTRALPEGAAMYEDLTVPVGREAHHDR